MTTTYSVTLDGKFLGRYTLSGDYGFVGPAQAACMTNRAEAEILAALHGGTVCLSPKWDDSSKSYRVPV